MNTPRYPALYQINTRVWLTNLSHSLGRPATLEDIPDQELDRLAEQGFDWIWFLSVWQTGPAAQQVSRSHPDWRREFQETLPDLTEEDIGGSGFAITGYTVHTCQGGDTALAQLRERLRQRGLKLMLDFVPNHMGLGHPWINEHPDYFIQGTELDLARAPQNYTWVKCSRGDRLLAHGRDPFFPGWPDTLQLNYANAALQTAMIGELERIATQCDGVRCDMAMLVLPDVFERTWGQQMPPFWPTAIHRVRDRFPGFLFMAEVYWDLEWVLQQQGFDYTYDKRLYDRLRDRDVRPIREHLQADLDYQNQLTRLLENHDEPRAAATFSKETHKAAALVTFLSPGLRFFHQGQFEGRQKRISPHLVRAPVEVDDHDLKQFYEQLLAVLKDSSVRDGNWRLLECVSAWQGNGSSNNILCSEWRAGGGQRLLVVVNFSPSQSQCYVRWPEKELGTDTWSLNDLMSDVVYERDGEELNRRGLYLDLSPWQYHVFQMKRR